MRLAARAVCLMGDLYSREVEVGPIEFGVLTRGRRPETVTLKLARRTGGGMARKVGVGVGLRRPRFMLFLHHGMWTRL